MDLIADILLIAGAMGAAFYCIVLARRLNRFTNLDQGVGGAIAVLSAQVDDMTKALAQAQGSASGSTDSLAVLTERAEEVARRLELLVASMHDLPEATTTKGLADQPKKPAPSVVAEIQNPAPGFASARRSNPENESEALFRTQRGWITEAAE